MRSDRSSNDKISRASPSCCRGRDTLRSRVASAGRTPLRSDRYNLDTHSWKEMLCRIEHACSSRKLSGNATYLLSMCAALELVRVQRGVRATPCTQQSQQQQQQQRTECVHTEREPGYSEVLYSSHACMYTFSDRIINTAVFFPSLIITYYVETSVIPNQSHPFNAGEPGLLLRACIMLLLTLKARRKKAVQTS